MRRLPTAIIVLSPDGHNTAARPGQAVTLDLPAVGLEPDQRGDPPESASPAPDAGRPEPPGQSSAADAGQSRPIRDPRHAQASQGCRRRQRKPTRR